MASSTSPSDAKRGLRWPVWLSVAAAVIAADGVTRLETGKPGPVERYVLASIHSSGGRAAKKFEAALENQATANAQTAGSRAANRLFKPVTPEKDLDKLVAAPEFDDPFTKRVPGLFIPHPFFGFAGVESNFPFHKDYFGMRNDEDLYFGKYDPATRCQVLFTWSGNSEAAGVYHERTVAQYLEDELNARDPAHAYKSLSLAVNGYALNDEISAYVALAYALKPEFSITHSGITDVAYGGTLPGGFKDLGLLYTFDAYYRWIDTIYDIQLVENVHPNARTLQPSEMDRLIPGILATYKRFNDIVAGNGGELIVGMPPYGKPTGENASAYWSEWMPKKVKELHDAMPPGSFVDFSKRADQIQFLDTIHTDTATAKMYAHVYAGEILRRMQTFKLNTARKGAPGSTCAAAPPRR